MRRCLKGFTLIELAVVLVILAISVTVLFPKFGTSRFQQVRFRSSVNRIASVAEYAHHRAACTQLVHLLHLDTERGTYWVTSQTTDGKVMPITDALSLKGRLPEGVQFAGVELRDMDTSSQDVVAIRFNPQGWADPAIIHLICSTGETLSVIIDELSGQVEICESEEMN